jgi:hypothetical protein
VAAHTVPLQIALQLAAIFSKKPTKTRGTLCAKRGGNGGNGCLL